MANRFGSFSGYTPSISVTDGIGLANNPQAVQKIFNPQVGNSLGDSVFGSSTDWANKFKLGGNQRFPNFYNNSTSPYSLKGLADSAGSVLDSIGGIGGVGDLLAGLGAWQSAGVERNKLKEATAARLFANNIAKNNTNNQVSLRNTQMQDRQDGRIARASGDGSVMATADYMNLNGLNKFTG